MLTYLVFRQSLACRIRNIFRVLFLTFSLTDLSRYSSNSSVLSLVMIELEIYNSCPLTYLSIFPDAVRAGPLSSTPHKSQRAPVRRAFSLRDNGSWQTDSNQAVSYRDMIIVDIFLFRLRLRILKHCKMPEVSKSQCYD